MSTKPYIGSFSQLADGVQVAGKVLTLKSDDSVVWATPYSLPIASASVLGGIKIGSGLSIDGSGILSTTGMTGSGTTNYIARWTNGTTLGTGLLRDNNTTVAINADPALYATSRLAIKETLIDKIPFLVDYVSVVDAGYVTNVAAKISAIPVGAQNGNITALQLRASNSRGINEGLNIGVQGSSSMGYPTQIGINCYIGTAPTMQGTNIKNFGVYVDVTTQNSTADSVGIYSSVSAVTGGGNRYAAQLQDGTQGVGKILTCITSDGKTNWTAPNPQKIITYPADFTGTNYTLTNADNGYSIIVINGGTAVTITIPTSLVAKMQVGFIQDGTGDVAFTGVTLNNATAGTKIKGQYEQVFLEQGLTTSIYYLLGNTKI